MTPMRTKRVRNVFVILLTCMCFASCVKKSEYETVCYDKFKLEQEVQNYQYLIAQKDQQIADLQSQLDNVDTQTITSNNEDKGKTELEYVKSTLDDLVRKMNNCQNQDDLDWIIKNSKDLKSRVDSYLFFNY